jgi:hypothetical protein
MNRSYIKWEDVAPADWPWRNFTPAEFGCKGTGRLVVVPEFMDRLQTVRSALGFALAVSSGFRAPEHNAMVSATGATGPHTTGRACDIVIEGAPAFALVRCALVHGFTGIGVAQKGKTRFIHLDDLADSLASPRPRLWSY